MKKSFFNLLLVYLMILAMVCFAACAADEPAEAPAAEQPAAETPAAEEPADEYADWPTGTITISTSSAAGAAQDLMSRQLATGMEEFLGVPVVVANNNGGGGAVSLAYVMGQDADGLTLLQDGTSLTALLLQTTTDYSMEDLIPVSRPQLDTFIFFVKQDGKYASVDDFVNACKERPGEIAVGGFGTASGQHIIMMLWAKEIGIDFKWVAYDSGNEAMLSLLNGDLDAVMSNTGVLASFGEEILGLWESGENRLETAPDIPTIAEIGCPDLTRYHWRGLFVKAGTPDPIVQKLAEAIKFAMETPEFIEYNNSNGLIIEYRTVEELKTLFDELTASDKIVLDGLGIATK